MFLTKVISGAQTGADRGGLIAAKKAGIPTGGHMPKGFKALDGFHPEFVEEYGIEEDESQSYPPRTYKNVKNSDGTVRFATYWSSPGEACTRRCLRKTDRPYYDIDPHDTQNGRPMSSPREVADWIINNNIRVLNVAGNSESTSPGIEEFTIEFLTEVFKLLS